MPFASVALMVGTLQLARTLTDLELSVRVLNRVWRQRRSCSTRSLLSTAALGIRILRLGVSNATVATPPSAEGGLAVAHGHVRLQNVDAAPET
jgi:hypothetical protein